ELIPPRNSTEQIIAGIWCEVLGLKTVSVFEDFFAVGGDSLRATQVVSRAGVAFQIDLPLGALFEQRTVAALAGTVEEIQDSQSTTGAGAQSEHDTGISLVMRTEHTTKEIGGTSMPQPGVEPFVFPPSFAQQRLWFLEQFDPGKSVYHLLYAVRFDGSLNLNALEQALNELVRRHESLRTSFVTVDGEPMQAIARELKLEVPVIDLLGLGKDNAEAEARRWWQIEGERPFDLTAAPMFRVHLLRLSADENVLVITLHHIISDGWSMGVFLRELSALYQAFREGQPSPLPELPIQYADYSVWQREWMQGEVLESQLSYWTKHLAGAPAALELATDRPHPAVQTFAGARHFTEISSDLADRLRAFSRRE